MMRKAKWKRVVAAGAILMSLGMVFPAADIQAEEVDFGPGIVEIVDDDNISTCADQNSVSYLQRKKTKTPLESDTGRMG